ncbi:transcriptional regulator [Roseivivax halodurans JCM 10272]|uniref:Transcriptional regulator n=1 Tax=Roseivivax halodurans JCM 10272 TaxID=1449350 RepID=X7EIU6_9RHOB|nr:Crp/Fnr family transcriptional regulator [Roseivivax halodurans]ETX15822.1 transcriptional regulator [Roseivivax halodurans JCM 10272]
MPSPKLRENCADCPIRYRAVCAYCEPDELEVLERIKSYSEIASGQPIFFAGEPMTHVASVVTGAAVLSRTLEDGRRQINGVMLPSDFIGRPWRETIPFDVTAAGPVTLCRFERKAFEAILKETPHVSERLLSMTLDDLDAARDWAVVLGRMAARERIAAFLLFLSRRLGKPTPGNAQRITFSMPLTREAIADALGLTLETASRQMSALRRDGLIETEGRSTVIVPDLTALQDEAQDDADGSDIL